MTEQDKMVVQMTRGELRAEIREAIAAAIQKNAKAAGEIMLTPEQVAVALGKCRKTIYKWRKDGRFTRFSGCSNTGYLISSLEVEEMRRFRSRR